MTTTDDTGEIPTVRPVAAPQPRSLTIGVVAIVAGIALVLGLVGGIASHAIFPPAAGAKGAAGAPGTPGAPGKTGPIGPTGSAANVDLSKLGVCVLINYGGDGVQFSWVSNVSVTTPTLTNGTTQSCPTGTFTPVQAAPVSAPTQ